MRVLELSDEDAAAAYAGKLFARWGSYVIKAESPDRAAPSAAEDLYVNGGKRRVAADYRTAEGRALLGRLAATCDILLTDASVSDIREFEILALGGDRGPRVRTTITPFGLTGPYARFPATEATLLALGGYTFLMGDPGREPLTMPGHYAAYQAATIAYVASLAAAMHTAGAPGLPPTTIDVSVLECLVGLHQFTDTRWLANQEIRGRHGNRFDSSAGTMLSCQDGWFGFSLTQPFWMPFALMLGRPDLVEGHVFSTNAGRLERRGEFETFVVDVLSGRRKHEIFTEGQETWRVAIGYMATLADCLADQYLEARKFWRPVECKKAPPRGPRCAPQVRRSASPARISRPSTLALPSAHTQPRCCLGCPHSPPRPPTAKCAISPLPPARWTECACST